MVIGPEPPLKLSGGAQTQKELPSEIRLQQHETFYAHANILDASNVPFSFTHLLFMLHLRVLEPDIIPLYFIYSTIQLHTSRLCFVFDNDTPSAAFFSVKYHYL